VSEAELHRLLCWGLIAIAAFTLIALFVMTAPYGRHARSGWGPKMPTRWGWIVMECPAVLVFAGCFFVGAHRFELVPLVLLALWQFHYVYRTFVFPLKIGGPEKGMAVTVVAMGMGFNVLNAYLNARHVSQLGVYSVSWLYDARFIAGAALFLAGRALHVRVDAYLLELRRGGYAIPRQGAFRWVSCPNYLGEVIEWIGWAVATWSLAGAAFAIFTIANLAPRAHAHHRWYRERFADYPRERKALIPFVW
jgi:protein-S-isoprenylcysteine O-methyltransferase Ste14